MCRPVVYVVDDDDVSRRAIGSLLSATGVSVQSFPSASAFLARLPTDSLGCVITDVRMPGTSGIELVRRLREIDPDLPVVVVSGFIDVADTVKAMKLGAVTVLTKPFEASQLREAIDLSFTLLKERRAKSSRRTALSTLFAQLTKGEWKVLQCLDMGLPNKVTASRLGVSPRTVEDRRRRIMEKLSADNVAALVHLLNEARALRVSLQLPDRPTDDGPTPTS